MRIALMTHARGLVVVVDAGIVVVVVSGIVVVVVVVVVVGDRVEAVISGTVVRATGEATTLSDALLRVGP